MIESRPDHRIDTILHGFLLPLIGSTVAVAYATGRWDLSALATGLAITLALDLFWRLDRALVQPQLKRVSRDWLQIGLGMSFSVLAHLLGATSALLLCSRIFGFEVGATVSWIVVGGIVIAFPVIHGTETALGFYRQLKEKERVEEQLRVLATQAELKALKAQIHPHFLFNTLNTIAQLIHTDPSLAEATVERMADMFRYVLNGSERRLVPLEGELAFVDGYLEIERARFGERLHVTREVAPQALPVPVPSLILQPLVENAIRHGRGADGSVDLTIRAQLQDDAVLVAIADQGPGMPSDHKVGEDPGHGLRNVDERLRKTYGQTYGLKIAANRPHGTAVTIRIPTEKQEE
jgi:sensor histidine kinase YesM